MKPNGGRSAAHAREAIACFAGYCLTALLSRAHAKAVSFCVTRKGGKLTSFA